jgi:hypothetical protein
MPMTARSNSGTDSWCIACRRWTWVSRGRVPARSSVSRRCRGPRCRRPSTAGPSDGRTGRGGPRRAGRAGRGSRWAGRTRRSAGRTRAGGGSGDTSHQRGWTALLRHVPAARTARAEDPVAPATQNSATPRQPAPFGRPSRSRGPSGRLQRPEAPQLPANPHLSAARTARAEDPVAPGDRNFRKSLIRAAVLAGPAGGQPIHRAADARGGLPLPVSAPMRARASGKACTAPPSGDLGQAQRGQRPAERTLTVVGGADTHRAPAASRSPA